MGRIFLGPPRLSEYRLLLPLGKHKPQPLGFSRPLGPEAPSTPVLEVILRYSGYSVGPGSSSPSSCASPSPLRGLHRASDVPLKNDAGTKACCVQLLSGWDRPGWAAIGGGGCEEVVEAPELQISHLGHKLSACPSWAWAGLCEYRTLLYLTNILSFLFPSALHVSARSARVHTHTGHIKSKLTGLPPIRTGVQV